MWITFLRKLILKLILEICLFYLMRIRTFLFELSKIGEIFSRCGVGKISVRAQSYVLNRFGSFLLSLLLLLPLMRLIKRLFQH